MSKFVDDIEAFHRKYGISYDGSPRLLPKDMQTFREIFLQEELDEFKTAWENENLVDAFDSLIDLVYVALGTAHMMGVPFAEGWDVVQRCNMQKIRVESADQSKRNSVYDVRKPEGWVGPESQLTDLLEQKTK